jgi:adenylate cyclase
VQILLVGVLLAGALAALPPAGVMLVTLGALTLTIAQSVPVRRATWCWGRHGGAADRCPLHRQPGLGLFFRGARAALVARFGEYVAPELVAEMADNPQRYTMDGENRD